MLNYPFGFERCSIVQNRLRVKCSKFLCTLLLALGTAVAQQNDLSPPLELNESKVTSEVALHRAAENLRLVVESIKRCPPLTYPGMDSDGGKTTDGPAMNVIWDIAPQSSARAPFGGYIEFVKPNSWMPPPKDTICTKKRGHVAYCEQTWNTLMKLYRTDEAHPHRYRYEFDYGEHGLELVRALQRINPDDDSHWADAQPSSCEGEALLKALKEQRESEAHLDR